MEEDVYVERKDYLAAYWDNGVFDQEHGLAPQKFEHRPAATIQAYRMGYLGPEEFGRDVKARGLHNAADAYALGFADGFFRISDRWNISLKFQSWYYEAWNEGRSLAQTVLFACSGRLDPPTTA